jgi:hypothetical protein
LDYEKYLVGRPYLLFKSAVRSEKVFSHINSICGISVILWECQQKKWFRNIKRWERNHETQQMVEDYVLLLQTKISNGEITAATGQTMIPPIKLLVK